MFVGLPLVGEPKKPVGTLHGTGWTNMKVRICYHYQCFDGMSSAILFTRLYREKINPSAEFHYTGLAHRAGQLFDEDLFDGDENVIVYFKYST